MKKSISLVMITILSVLLFSGCFFSTSLDAPTNLCLIYDSSGDEDKYILAWDGNRGYYDIRREMYLDGKLIGDDYTYPILRMFGNENRADIRDFKYFAGENVYQVRKYSVDSKGTRKNTGEWSEALRVFFPEPPVVLLGTTNINREWRSTGIATDGSTVRKEFIYWEGVENANSYVLEQKRYSETKLEETMLYYSGGSSYGTPEYYNFAISGLSWRLSNAHFENSENIVKDVYRVRAAFTSWKTGTVYGEWSEPIEIIL